MAFEIHPRLAAGGFEIGTLHGCRVLLKNNALFPWFILVPEVEGIEEPHELPEEIYLETMLAVRKASAFTAEHFRVGKLNVAWIGNQVRQMHIHVVGRSAGDPAWPGTVWAFEGKEGYTEEKSGEIVVAARKQFGIREIGGE